jgi:hypothetical protein
MSNIIKQKVLPFKIEKTQDSITPHGGLSLVGEFMVGSGIIDAIKKHMPVPGSGHGYKPSEYIFPLLLMLHGGGRSLEDIRQISQDEALREVLPLERIPSTDAIGDWLRRMGAGDGLSGLEKVNQILINRGMKGDGRKKYTLDIDATGIEAEKESAKMTYKGYRGYMPIVGHIAENGLIAADEFREGNISPATQNLEFIKQCSKQMPAGKRIGFLRADSASYQAGIINYCQEQGVKFAIGGDLDSAVMKLIKAIPRQDWSPYQDGFIAEAVHSMEKTKKAFRLIVIRRPYQQNLFTEEDPKERYKVIATNRGKPAQEVVRWYNQRGEKSENRIKELKIGFGMERMPCGQLDANAVFFRIATLAYNLYKLFLLKTLPSSWHRHQVQTVRWRLYQVAAKVVFHAGQIFVKIHRRFYDLFKDIRLRTWEFAHIRS